LLLSLEPRSYAQAIGGAIAELRPGLEVAVVAPEDLLVEIRRKKPAIVLCGEPRPEGLGAAVRWAQFCPYEEPEVVRVDGLAEDLPGLDLEDLLGLVDRLCGSHGTPRLG
jgi:hypothetical protein